MKSQSDANIAARFNYVASTDITRFYHSIYTHSIAWSLHGKGVAKANRSDISLLGNRIDTLVRNAQDGQTIGIPVGPDTSRIIAEVIGAGIDAIIADIDGPRRGDLIRFVDDITGGANTIEEADHLVSTFRRAAHAYELELNDSKKQRQKHK